MEDVLVLLYVDNSFDICCFHWWIIFVAVQSLVFVTLVLIKLKQKCDVELFGKHSSAANWIKRASVWASVILFKNKIKKSATISVRVTNTAKGQIPQESDDY